MHHQDLIALGEFGDGGKLPVGVVARARRHRGYHCQYAGITDQERVAVRRRRSNEARPDRAAGAGPVLDHDGLAELGQDLRQQPRRNIGRSACSGWYDKPDRPVRISLGAYRSVHQHDGRNSDDCGEDVSF